MSIKDDLLAYIVEASKPNANAQNPLGYCYLEAGHQDTATELHNEELIQALVTSRQPDGSFPVRPTQAALTWAATRSSAQQPTQPVKQRAAAPSAMPIETGIPIPEKKAFGRSSDGSDKVTQFGFANMAVNASFFLPQPAGADQPIHRTFSSTVSQANKKLHPMNFVIREWKQPDGQVGARVWRTEDRSGDRPTRTRAKRTGGPVSRPQETPQEGQGWPLPQSGAVTGPASGQGFSGAFPAPASPGFGAPGFAAPAGDGGSPWGSMPAAPPLPDFPG